MGLLFQPRWCGVRPAPAGAVVGDDVPRDRSKVLLAALEAVVLGDASRFAELFTEDVVLLQPAPGGRVVGGAAAGVGLPGGLVDATSASSCSRSTPSGTR